MYIYHIFTENVAYGKIATESEAYVSKGLSTPACAAVNGRTNNIYVETGQKNCAHTTNARGSWWLVDLGRKYTVTDVTIYTRAGNLLTNRERKDECECVEGVGGGVESVSPRETTASDTTSPRGAYFFPSASVFLIDGEGDV